MFGKPKARRFVTLCSSLLLAGLLVAACDEDPPTDPGPDAVEQQLDALRAAMEGFEDIEAAKAAGWNVRFPPECLTHSELGGMGVHQLNPDLVDDVVSVTQPELLVYEPQPDGTLEFVAVEYIVPFAERPRDASPPVLFERDFHHVDAYEVWGLHAWAWADNPAGTFQDWNPDVTCAGADTVRTFP